MFRNIKSNIVFDNINCPTYTFENNNIVPEVSINNGSYLSCTISDRLKAGLPLNTVNPTVLHDNNGFASLANEVINNANNTNN